jgi:hypothetical protein
MTVHQGAPMPEALQHWMRAKQHPARSVDCPHCKAVARRPCTTPSKRRQLELPHPQRVSAWAQTTACCAECQVEPTIPCHDEGRARTTVHNRRHQEAEATAA